MNPVIPDLSTPAGWLPLVFLFLMALAMLAYVVLDGYDLGVGILLRRAGSEAERDTMIAAIGPFWDANETWLVLGVGLLLVAFPVAHGVILGALYLPVALMLIGLILRGVAFDFRVKARAQFKPWWDRTFYAGSLIAALSQGWMLGRFVTGFGSVPLDYVFAAATALGLTAGYALLGAGWLLIKTEGELQQRARRWAQGAVALTALGVLAISLATPLVSERIAAKWFSFPNILLLAPIPLMSAALFGVIVLLLRRFPAKGWHWVPFAATVGIFTLAFHGLAYSLFPYVVPERTTAWQAAAAPESLMVIFVGACVVLPCIIGYTAFAYWVFRGKAQALHYG